MKIHFQILYIFFKWFYHIYGAKVVFKKLCYFIRIFYFNFKWSHKLRFYAPGLKGPPGASSNRIVRLSVCLSVCPSVRNSVPLTIKVQYLKFGWWYNYQTWTVSSSKGCSHFTDITRPWGVGQGQNVGLTDFCHNWTLLPPGASVFHKHMSSFFFKEVIFFIEITK